MVLIYSAMRRGPGNNALCGNMGHCEIDQEDRTSWVRVRSEISLRILAGTQQTDERAKTQTQNSTLSQTKSNQIKSLKYI